MRVLMVGRRPSVALNDLRRYWGHVDFMRPPGIPRSSYDLVIAQEPTKRVGPFAYLASRLTGSKLIVEVHGDYLNFLQRRLDKGLAILLLRRAHYVRGVNHGIIRSLRAHGIERTILIPAVYVDVQKFRFIKRHASREPELLFVGRLEREKGLDLLLRSFEIVASRDDRVTLRIVGAGSLYPYLLRSVRSMGLSHRVTVSGRWIPQEELVNIYNSSSIILCTSDYEGGPRVLFEAAACGTPFVSTPVGLISEVCEDGSEGFIVRGRDPRIIAKKVLEALQDPDLRDRMGEAGRRLVEGRFEWNSAIQRYAESYLKLVESVSTRLVA
ncbi:MAG: glycosyltransferase family 4 protein [Aigarchaeota archaeon]|nr:glycosyltransferase family 4 protein [Aigarchaeota archaeon]MDW8092179.1 glycosyltransferase family 4 protein [Nitrososphaerota archaeon]